MSSSSAIAKKLSYALFTVGLGAIAGALPSWTDSAHAVPVTIADNYIGGQPTNPAFSGLDIVGDADKFDINSLQVEIANNSLNIGIKSTYFDNVGLHGTTFGDVLISSNGWNPFGPAPYNQDTASNGESWEYALVFSNHGEQLANNGQVGSMIGSSGTVSLVALGTNAQIGLSYGTDFRANQEVGVLNPQALSVLSLGAWNIAAGQNGFSSLNLSISLANIPSLLAAEQLGFHFGFSCGNDVIEGAYSNPQNTEVPEPSSVVLLYPEFPGWCVCAVTAQRHDNCFKFDFLVECGGLVFLNIRPFAFGADDLYLPGLPVRPVLIDDSELVNLPGTVSLFRSKVTVLPISPCLFASAGQTAPTISGQMA